MRWSDERKNTGMLTRKKIFHALKCILIFAVTSIILLSLLGTVAHATGLVDDTVSADNLYSKYPLSNYQLDFYVDNSWGWLPWNWLDGIGKSVQYGLYCITNFIWTISLYLSNATGYVVQEAYKLDFINDMADSIGQSIQTLAGVTSNGFWKLWLLCRGVASHYPCGRYLRCLYRADKARNQQGTSRRYQLRCGISSLRFLYRLCSRLYQKNQ